MTPSTSTRLGPRGSAGTLDATRVGPSAEYDLTPLGEPAVVDSTAPRPTPLRRS